MLCVRATGERREVAAELGRPYQTQAGDWACPVSLEPLHQRLADVHGLDSLQALCLAASLVRNLLTGFRDEGGRILQLQDGADFDLNSTFSGIGRTAR